MYRIKLKNSDEEAGQIQMTEKKKNMKELLKETQIFIDEASFVEYIEKDEDCCLETYIMKNNTFQTLSIKQFLPEQKLKVLMYVVNHNVEFSRVMNSIIREKIALLQADVTKEKS